MSQIIKMDEPEPTLDDEPELLDTVATYNAEVERPSAFEESTSTLLSVGTWSLVEGQVASASTADLEEIRRSACAT